MTVSIQQLNLSVLILEHLESEVATYLSGMIIPAGNSREAHVSRMLTAFRTALDTLMHGVSYSSLVLRTVSRHPDSRTGEIAFLQERLKRVRQLAEGHFQRLNQISRQRENEASLNSGTIQNNRSETQVDSATDSDIETDSESDQSVCSSDSVSTLNSLAPSSP